jgi:short subunit dehydrogenase-like uncharacterized protein
MLLYGANGYTGELIAREAARRGMRPILAGRNGSAVAALAAELGLEWRVFGLEDAAALRASISDAGLVVHCAGPFVHTSAPVVAACLEAGVSYQDITGEIAVFERVLALGDEAKRAGIVLLPGSGFDVVPTDCLAMRLAELLPSATHLDLAFVNEGGSWSRGTLATLIESLPAAGAVRRDGRIVPVPLAHETMTLELPAGTRTLMTIPWGDVATAFHTTGIPNIRVFSGVPPRTLRRLRRWRWALPFAGLAPIKRLLQARVRRTVTGPNDLVRLRSRVHLWGRVRDGDGREAIATLVTPEGYTLTARAAVEIARRLEARALPAGAWTPARAFGARFVAGIPGVELGEGWRN